MPPLSWRRKLHTIVHATSETTTGEKKIVRNTVMPATRRLRSTARKSASPRLRTTSPAEKTPVACRTGASFGSLMSFSKFSVPTNRKVPASTFHSLNEYQKMSTSGTSTKTTMPSNCGAMKR